VVIASVLGARRGGARGSRHGSRRARFPNEGSELRTVAVAIYLAGGAALSYLVWGPWEGVDPRPFSWWVILLVLTFHVAVGAAVGRWWGLGLPLVWAVISVPADGYDTPVATQIAFQTLFLWAPALAVGIAGSKLARLPFLWARSS
jgi:hypothetical protein